MMNNKQTIRKEFQNIRENLSIDRKLQAQTLALQIINLNYQNILSFASFGSEINLWPLNEQLAKQKRLFLPKVENESLQIFQVLDIKNDLQASTLGILEPKPICRLIDPKDLSCILVPGLAFDKDQHRLGYGKGFYDNFLKTINCHTIGVGYTEQLTDKLPTYQNDVKLKELLLF
ncbi:MAG: 5-formyltetrahydrofolate cyclo-ligase [Chlamydiae bacterium]|nr:5-formyltetrahydrofolate cyclo-ligase [Chlamydiota bacterium]